MARAPKDSEEHADSTAADREIIRALARILDEAGLTEIELERDGLRVRIARQAQPIASAAPRPAVPAPGAIPADDTAGDAANHPGTVPSPMVGTAYLAPEPGARPFVEVGSQVRIGQTLLIIEAMKTMNQIPAPRAGRVVQVLVNDGQPVEFGEPLMIIE
ncbi:MAG: acetyl-CoA carboxylase biotin carboxyl carrier protein [Hyphomicrobiales bacterium]|nr:acetyl-CoA carboxylase biotin carboxyl carrier protein [Hyphomicrobiales bacterium]